VSWQRVRIAEMTTERVAAHPRQLYSEFINWPHRAGLLIRVAHIDSRVYDLIDAVWVFRYEGCQSDHFYEVHPDDISQLTHQVVAPGSTIAVCEHILEID